MQKAGIILLLILYWLFAVLKGLDINFSCNNKLIQKATIFLLPPNYRMFIGPYKTKFLIIYTFYKNNKVLETVNTTDYFRSHIKQEFPFSNKTYRLSVGIEDSFYYVDYEYQKKFEELKNKKLDRKSINRELGVMLSSHTEIKKNFKTLANFHKVIVENNQDLKQATKVKVLFKRIPVILDYKDSMAYVDHNLTYEIGEKTFYEETLVIK